MICETTPPPHNVSWQAHSQQVNICLLRPFPDQYRAPYGLHHSFINIHTELKVPGSKSYLIHSQPDPFHQNVHTANAIKEKNPMNKKAQAHDAETSVPQLLQKVELPAAAQGRRSSVKEKGTPSSPAATSGCCVPAQPPLHGSLMGAAYLHPQTARGTPKALECHRSPAVTLTAQVLPS